MTTTNIAIAGWQAHPSRNITHYFVSNSLDSICRLERRTNNGQVTPTSGQKFACARCLVALRKKEDKDAIPKTPTLL